MGAYAAGTIAAFDPEKPISFPDNPRCVLHIGHEQMRPGNNSVRFDGQHLWFATHAQYGKRGGALVCFDPEKETCKVWRNLVPEHNPGRLCLSNDKKEVFVGTSPDADCNSAPPADTPAAIFCFDVETEQVVWLIRPLEHKAGYYVPKVITPKGDLFVFADQKQEKTTMLLIDPADGTVKHHGNIDELEEKGVTDVFCAHNRMYVTTRHGLFEYDPEKGLGKRIIDTLMQDPRVRGNDLFFRWEWEAGLVEGLFEN